MQAAGARDVTGFVRAMLHTRSPTDQDLIWPYSLISPRTGRRARVWHTHCPTLLPYGAATWAATREEVLGNVREVIAMVVARMAEDGVPVPAAPDEREEPATGRGGRIAITVAAPVPEASPGLGEGAP